MIRLGRYVLWEILWFVFLTLLVLVGLFVFFDLINELGDVGKSGYQLHNAVIYVLLNAPRRAYELLPVSVLIGSIFALSGMADTSQITVMRTSGVSILRFTGWLLVGGAILAGATFAIGEYIAPRTSAAATRYQVAAKQQVMFSSFQSGVWVKDDKQIINVSSMLPNMTLQNLRIYQLVNSSRLAAILDIKTARFKGAGHWQLENVTRTRFDNNTVIVSHEDTADWQSSINPGMLAVLMLQPQEMSAQALSTYIDHLEANRQSTQRYELAFWSKLFYPLAAVAMMMIALPFALGQRRSGNVGIKIFLGILLGVSFNFVNQMMGYVGELYALPPVVIAGLPTLGLCLLASYFLWRQEKG